MTDTPERAPTAPPTVSDNVRAEIARAGLTAREVRSAMLNRGIHLAASTWDDRMRTPGTWRLRELETIAEVLGRPINVLVGDR